MSLLELVRRLGLEGDLRHLEEALTHPSYGNERRYGRERRTGKRVDNQRLEFLGDAVLGLCVSEILMERFPAAREGELSLMRAALVNTDALAAWARLVGIGPALRLGRGADAAGERWQTNVLADAVEAMVGAVYFDCGIEAARRLSEDIVAEPLASFVPGPMLGRDAKSELQERVQADGRAAPRYRIVAREGPDHDRRFIAIVEIGDDVAGTGTGRSKKLAEQQAARAALRSLYGDPSIADGAAVAEPDSEARPPSSAPPAHLSSAAAEQEGTAGPDELPTPSAPGAAPLRSGDPQ